MSNIKVGNIEYKFDNEEDYNKMVEFMSLIIQSTIKYSLVNNLSNKFILSLIRNIEQQSSIKLVGIKFKSVEIPTPSKTIEVGDMNA